MAEFKLGRLKFWWKGDWQTGHAYVKDDVIRFGGRSYVCIGAHTSGIDDESFYTALETDPYKWELMTDGIQWKGTWVDGTYYKEGDIVKYGSDTYICVDGHTSDADFWTDEGTVWNNFVNGVELEGDWSASAQYQVGDIVRLGGNTFIAKRDNDGVQPGTAGSEDDWGIFVHGLKWKGQYDAAVTYYPGDVVKEGVSSYVAIDQTVGTAPSADLTNVIWNAVAEGDATDVLTTTGDMVVYGATNVQRLPAGASSAILQIDDVSGVPVWNTNVYVPGDLTVEGDAAIISGSAYQGPGAKTYINDVDIFYVEGDITSASKSGTQLFIYYADGSALANATTAWVIGFSGVADPNTVVNDEWQIDSNNTVNKVVTVTVPDLTGTGTVSLAGAEVYIAGPNAYAGITDASGVFVGDADSFVQLALKNVNPGQGASTDMIVYASNGDNNSGWMDMGITGENFEDSSWTITGKNDGYIFMSAPTGTDGNGDLVMGTGNGGKHNDIRFFTGGFDAANVKMALIGTQRDEISESTGLPTGKVIQPGVEIYLNSNAQNYDEGALRVKGGIGLEGNLVTKGDLRAEFGVITQGSNAKNLQNDDYLYPGYVGLTDTSAIMTGNVNSFVQMALKNFNTGDSASTDMILYSSAGDNDSGWIDMGICSENFDDPTYGVTGRGDGYIFMSAKERPVGEQVEDGNLYVSTSGNGLKNDIVFSTGGFEDSSYERMRIIGTARAGKAPGVEIYSTTNSSSPTTGALRVQGGIGVLGNLNVGGSVSINGDTTIQGQIVIAGGSTTVTSQNLAVQDPMIFCGDGNDGNSVDLGVVGSYRVAADTYTPVTLTGASVTAAGEDVYIYAVGHGCGTKDRVTISNNTSDTAYNTTYETVTVIDDDNLLVNLVGGTRSGPLVGASVSVNTFVNGLRYNGVVRDHIDGWFKVFTDYQSYDKPSTTIDFASTTAASLSVNAIDAGGRVLISDNTDATSFSTGALQVVGGVGVEGSLYVNGASYFYNDVTAWYSSDSRLKTNITPINDALVKISQIGGYTFDWTAEANKGEAHDVGVIAQEVQAVLPEVVVERDNGYLAVNYEKLVPLLIQGIKELQDQVNELKAKLGE